MRLPLLDFVLSFVLKQLFSGKKIGYVYVTY